KRNRRSNSQFPILNSHQMGIEKWELRIASSVPGFSLLLAPAERQTACDFGPCVCMSEHIRHRSASHVGSKTDRAPQPQRFYAAAMAHRKEGVVVFKDDGTAGRAVRVQNRSARRQNDLLRAVRRIREMRGKTACADSDERHDFGAEWTRVVEVVVSGEFPQQSSDRRLIGWI